MSSWPPIVWIFLAIAAAIAVAFFWSIRMKNKNDQRLQVFYDTVPMDNSFTPQSVSFDLNTSVHNAEIQLPVTNPALQIAQDNLNYTLWHQLLWIIPNTQWVTTQYESLAEVQWLCLGPDHYYFTAHADLSGDEWRWTFTKA